MKYLYKYPQSAYPYDELVATNRGRGAKDFEYELLGTGVFDQNRYFDVFVEYAKASPEDLLVQITICNRGPEAADLRVLPTVWFRNIWSWRGEVPRPGLRQLATGKAGGVIAASSADRGTPEGGGRILRLGHPGKAGRRRGQRDAPGDRRHALVQAVLLLRPRHLAHRARRQSLQPQKECPSQRSLAPHAQRGHHLDARQVGIPLVRGLGPRLPRPRAHPGRRRFREAPAGPDARGPVPPPQRAASRLRVELRRRESTGARLGHDLHLPPGKAAPRRGRPRLARAVVP